MTPEEAMFQEAMSAIHSGERARARDLLTRLLKMNQGNPEYWLWMSAMVNTPRERSYCLNEVLHRDPQNTAAMRGLQVMGLAPVNEGQIVPQRYQKHNWQPAALETDGQEQTALLGSWRQVAILVGAVLVLAALVGLAIFGTRQARKTARIIIPTDFPIGPTTTSVPTLTPLVRSPTPTFIGPTPLWMMMKATYTPTPLYVNTPHPISEAYRIGIRAYLRADWPSVVDNMLQVATIEPGAADLYYYAGEASRFQNDLNGAMGYYTKAIAANPGFAPAYLGRARARLEIDAKSVPAARADLETAIQKDPNLVDAYLDLASILVDQKQYDDALSLLDHAAEIAPGTPLTHLYRGEVYLNQGEAAKALVEARAASELDFTLLPAYLFLGEALQANGLAADSLKPLQTYLQYVQDDPQAYVLLSQAYEANQQIDAAMSALSSAIKLNSNLPGAYVRRADFYMAQKNYDQAANDFRQAYKLDNENYRASIGLGEALLMSDFAGDAYMQFERTKGLAESNTQKAELYYYEAQSLEELKETDVALRFWNQLLALPKEDVDPDWLSYAAARVSALSSATPQPTNTLTLSPTPTRPTVTITPSRTPTQTRQPTQTRMPTQTIKPTATP